VTKDSSIPFRNSSKMWSGLPSSMTYIYLGLTVCDKTELTALTVDSTLEKVGIMTATEFSDSSVSIMPTIYSVYSVFCPVVCGFKRRVEIALMLKLQR